MTNPANAIRDVVWGLIELQIETLGQSSRLTASDLSQFHARAVRIKELSQELDRIARIAVLEKRFGRFA